MNGAKSMFPKTESFENLVSMPFGKYEGTLFNELPESYLKYWLLEVDVSDPIWVYIVDQFKILAEERGYFDKWENEKLAIDAKNAKSNYVGNVRDRIEVFLRCDKILSFDGNYGPYHMHMCVDKYDNAFIYSGSQKWEEGNYYKVRATIKDQKEYKGKNQNYISRPSIIKVIQKTS